MVLTLPGKSASKWDYIYQQQSEVHVFNMERVLQSTYANVQKCQKRRNSNTETLQT